MEGIVSAADLARYREQGVVVLRGVIPKSWLQRAAAAVDRVLANPTPTGVEYTPEGESGRYYGDFFVWRVESEIEAFFRESPLPAIAAEVLQSDEVYLFYDQLLVKEPRTKEPTPLHQDLPYWPIRNDRTQGAGILSIWVPFDPVPRSHGAVRYLEGSHRWGKFYAPASFSDRSSFGATYEAAGLEKMPEPAELIRTSEELCWETEPGDVVLHHSLTLHHAPGNDSSSVRRRALAVRFVAKDVVYDARPGTFLSNPSFEKTLPAIGLADGDPLRGELFPRLWPRG
jgi:ectoine hydroxylase-related dioxygenase (phytanoyl-CoA dioxygenase family)